MPQEEDTKFKWSFQDEIARTERELGLWNGGNTSIYSYLSAFNKAFQNGYKSDFTQFMRDVDKQASNSDFNGQLTFSYTTQEKSTAKFGKERIGDLEFVFTEFIVYPTIKHSITINLYNGSNDSEQENSYDWDGLIKYLTYKSGGPATILSFTGKLAQRNIITKYKSGGDFLEALKDFKSVGKLGSVANKIGYIGLGVNALQVGVGALNGTNKNSDYLRLAINVGLTLITISNPIGIVAIGIYGVLDYYYGDQLWKSSGIDD